MAHKLTVLRDRTTDSPTFRRLTEELVTLLAYEATREVRISPTTVQTPLMEADGVKLSAPRPLVVPILRAGLVDRFRIVVFPVITGATGSERIFDGYPDVALELTESRTFEGGLQLLDYVPTVLEGPPGGSAG